MFDRAVIRGLFEFNGTCCFKNEKYFTKYALKRNVLKRSFS